MIVLFYLTHKHNGNNMFVSVWSLFAKVFGSTETELRVQIKAGNGCEILFPENWIRLFPAQDFGEFKSGLMRHLSSLVRVLM